MLYETECWIIKNQHKNKIVETQLRWFSNVEKKFIDFVVRKVNQMFDKIFRIRSTNAVTRLVLEGRMNHLNLEGIF